MSLNFDVVIVGAGVAGLAAAHELAKAENNEPSCRYSILVVEARDRIGGRLLSSSGPYGVDLGGSWLHGGTEGANPLLPLLRPDTLLYPVRNAGKAVHRNPWTQAGADTLTVLVPGSSTSSSYVRLPPDDVHSASRILHRARAVVGERVRGMEEGECIGMTAEELLKVPLRCAIEDEGADQNVCTAVAALIHLLGAWNGGTLADLPATEGCGWGLAGGDSEGFVEGLEEDEDGEDGDYVGAHSLVGMASGTAMSQVQSHPGCLAQVPDTLASQAGLRIVRIDEMTQCGLNDGPYLALNTVLETVDWKNTDGIALDLSTCSGMVRVNARNVVLTLPAPCLAQGHVTFVPPPPTAMVEAWTAVPHCMYKKIVLEFDRVWWPSSTPFWYFGSDSSLPSDPSVPEVTLMEDYALLKGIPVLVGILIGDATLQADPVCPWSDEACVDGLLVRLKAVFAGEAPGAVTGWAASHWETDKYAGFGAYARTTPITTEAHLEALMQPLQAGEQGSTVYFAGDAWCGGHLGSAHGALTSGRAAAQHIKDACSSYNRT